MYNISLPLCCTEQNGMGIRTYIAFFPDLIHLSVTCSTEKRGEPGIFSHLSMTYCKLGSIVTP